MPASKTETLCAMLQYRPVNKDLNNKEYNLRYLILENSLRYYKKQTDKTQDKKSIGD